MSAEQDAIDKAAREEARNHQGMHGPPQFVKGFVAGVAWARANPSPEVLALVNCLRTGLQAGVFAGQLKYVCEHALAAFKAKERP